MDPSDLYGLPLDRFVPERTALAKELRSGGRGEEARAVTAMRKPSLAAWAVNQLVRTQGAAVGQLFSAGDALQEAQAELLAGRAGGAGLRDAMARERSAVSGLVQTAHGLLGSQGQPLGQAMLERVSETLHAAALDLDARAQVQDGCLVRELRRVGLGSVAAGAEVEPRAGARARAKEAQAEQVQAEQARAEQARVEQARAARAAEADSRRAAEHAEHQLEIAQAHRDEAARALREADQSLAAARRLAQRAAREHERAARAVDRL